MRKVVKVIITIHQSQYLPWLPYFDKILRSDIFVILDDVQFQKNGIQNRNQIKTPDGPMWLTVPVKHEFGQFIKEVRVVDQQFIKKHLKSFTSYYSKTPYFKNIFDELCSIYTLSQRMYLHKLNIALIKFILNKLETKVKIIESSTIKKEGKASDLILSICKKLGAKTYISGQGGHNYLNLPNFENSGIKVIFQNYRYPNYRQTFMGKVGFIPNLSVIDLLFNEGPNSKEIILSGG